MTIRKKRIGFYRKNKKESDQDIKEQIETVRAYCYVKGFVLLDNYVAKVKRNKIDELRQQTLRDAIKKCEEEGAELVTPFYKRIYKTINVLNLLVQNNIPITTLDHSFGDTIAERRRYLRMLNEKAMLIYENHSAKIRQGLKDSTKDREGASPKEAGSIGGIVKASGDLDYADKVYNKYFKGKDFHKDYTFKQIAESLHKKKVLTRAGKKVWALSSVRNLMKRGERNE